jgi:hypothetical protein
MMNEKNEKILWGVILTMAVWTIILFLATVGLSSMEFIR